jgi:hypothetical protein
VVSNLHVVNADNEGALRIYFSKIKNAKGYDIYRCDDKFKTYVKIKTRKGSGTTSFLAILRIIWYTIHIHYSTARRLKQMDACE